MKAQKNPKETADTSRPRIGRSWRTRWTARQRDISTGVPTVGWGALRKNVASEG